MNHYNIIELYPGGIVTQHILDFAEIPSFNELVYVDLDNDNRVTPEELNQYKITVLDRFLENYSYTLQDDGGRTFTLTPEVLRNHVILSNGMGSLTCIQVQLAFLFRLN